MVLARLSPPDATLAQVVVAVLWALYASGDEALLAQPAWRALPALLPTQRILVMGHTDDMAYRLYFCEGWKRDVCAAMPWQGARRCRGFAKCAARNVSKQAARQFLHRPFCGSATIEPWQGMSPRHHLEGANAMNQQNSQRNPNQVNQQQSGQKPGSQKEQQHQQQSPQQKQPGQQDRSQQQR
jgi:hypothetical protein